MTRSRSEYEFDISVKRYVKEKAQYKCEKCGDRGSEENRLEVDHIVAIWFAQKNPVLIPEIIKHIANSRLLCQRCHDEKHATESYEEYRVLALTLLEEWHEYTRTAIERTRSI